MMMMMTSAPLVLEPQLAAAVAPSEDAAREHGARGARSDDDEPLDGHLEGGRILNSYGISACIHD